MRSSNPAAFTCVANLLECVRAVSEIVWPIVAFGFTAPPSSAALNTAGVSTERVDHRGRRVSLRDNESAAESMAVPDFKGMMNDVHNGQLRATSSTGQVVLLLTAP
jgi:hypothetical protein